jgi:replicative DNA helicase
MADLFDKEQFEAEKDLAVWKELQASILQAILDTIKGLFPGAEVEKGEGLTIEKKKGDPNQNLEIEKPLASQPETSPTLGYTQLYGNGVNNLTPENIKAIHAILRSYTGDTVVGGEGLIIKFNGRTLYETDETGKIITHTGISHELRDRLEAIQPGAKSTPAQVQPAQSNAAGQTVGGTAEAPAKDNAAKNGGLAGGDASSGAKSPDKDSKNTIEEAITFLASRDDGAKKADGKGFNADDSYFGNKLAKDIADGATIDADRAKIALDLLQKYSRQLSTGGYSLPKWDDVKDQYPPKTIATDLSKEAAQERLANSIVLPPNFNTEERRAANQEPALHIIADPLGLFPPLRTESSRLDDSEPPEIPRPAKLPEEATIAEDIPPRAIAWQTTEPSPEEPVASIAKPEADVPIDAIEDRLDNFLPPSFRSAEPLATPISPEVEALPLVEEAEPATYEQIAEGSLEIPAFRGTRETTRPFKLPEEATIAEDIPTRSTTELKPEVEDRSVSRVAYPGWASPSELSEEPTAPAVVEAAASTTKPEPEVEAVVAPMELEVSPSATEATNVQQEPEVTAPKLSIGQKISQKITDAAKDAAKTVTDAVVSKIKSDIEATNDAVVRPVTDAIKSKAQESINFTAGVFKETIDDAANLAGNTAQNLKNAISIKSVGDLPLVNKYYDAVRSISAGIIPESDKEIAETIDKSVDAVKGMFDEIQENDQAAETEQLNEVAIAEQARREGLKDYKQVKVLFQIFSLNTTQEHNTLHGRQGVVDFPNGSQLSTNITDQGVASISLVENGKISELGSYNAKTMEYSLGKDLKDSAASLQQLKEHINLDFTIRPSTAKEVVGVAPAAVSIPSDSVVKETVSKPTEKPQLRTDKPFEERTLLDAEIEGQLIAKIVLEPDAFNKAVEQGVTAKSFDYLPYQEAFKAAQKLAADGKPTDLQSVVDEVKNEQFTKTIINDIQAEQPLSAEYLSKAVATKEFKQNTLNAANTIRRDAYGETPIDQVAAKSIDLINSAKDGQTIVEPAASFSPLPKPLNNVASEQKVVAALITAPNLYQGAVEAGLTSDSFTNPQAKKIFEAVSELSAEGEEVNILSVRNRLDTPDDKLLASNLSVNLPALPTVVADIKKVIELSTRRDLVKAADRLTDAAYNPKSNKQSLKIDLDDVKAKIDSSLTSQPPRPPTATVKEEPVAREKPQASSTLLSKMEKIAGKPAIEPDSTTKKTSEAKAKKEKAPAEKKTATAKKAPKATVVEKAAAKKPPVATVMSEKTEPSKGGR